MTTEYTANRLYPKPDFDTRTWHDQMHLSLDMIDQDMINLVLAGGTTLVSWANAHAYEPPQVVFDLVMQQSFVCEVAHTSAAVGTFADDRAAHPTYWSGVGTPFTSVGYTWTAPQIISVTASGTALTIQSNDGSAAPGPMFDLIRNSPSPAVNDVIGAIRFQGRNSTTGLLSYGQIVSQIVDPTSGSEDSIIFFNTLTAGGLGAPLVIQQGVFSPNATGVDKGVGTANFTALYENGVAISDKYAVASAGGTGRNLIRRNGGFEIHQRQGGIIGGGNGLSGAGAAVITFDGWLLTDGGTQFQSAYIVAGLTPGSQLACRIERAAADPNIGISTFEFMLDTDEIAPMLGQWVRLSFHAKAGANWSPVGGALQGQLVVGTGNPTKVSNFVGPTYAVDFTANLTSTVTRYQRASTVFIPTTTKQASVRFAWAHVGVAGADDSATVDNVQLEVVPDPAVLASPYEHHLMADMMRWCSRHYQKTFPYATIPGNNRSVNQSLSWNGITATAPSFFHWRLPTKLRLAAGAVCNAYGPAPGTNFQIRNMTDAADFTVTAATQLGEDVIQISGTPNAGMGAGDLLQVHCVVDAGIV